MGGALHCSEMTYTVSSGTLLCYTIPYLNDDDDGDDSQANFVNIVR